MYITFTVEIKDQQYYGGPRGEAQTEIEIPEHLIEALNVGSIFEYLVKSAQGNYYESKAEEMEKEEE